METDFSGKWVKRFRILTLTLIFSGALNIALLASFIFFVLQDKESSFSISRPASIEKRGEATNGEFFASLSKLTFRELISFLTNRDLVEEGYTKRDLAVAALVAFHHFNLEKALSAPPAQKRVLQMGKETAEIFPGLSDEQFEAIVRFAYQEKWPLTAKGLFSLMQKLGREDESLKQAFYVTPEFYALQILFQKTEAQQDPNVLLNLICEGNWDLLMRFTLEQTQMLDLSLEKRRRLLLSYLALKSPTAAQLLLRTDFAFALKRLDDQGILDILSLLSEKTPEAERFCTELLRSPRSDVVWQASALRIYHYLGETAPASVDPKVALARVAPTASAAPAAPAAVQPDPVVVVAMTLPNAPLRQHVVQDGENLWKIARQYKIKVDELIKANDLEKDRLFPGMTLVIPQGTGSQPPR
ncbi:MAG TPA: LysM domain-containing protein [Chlamydiales bacterium]|nr:LysM domain-containing protein [Chlamydiales bacterium]